MLKIPALFALTLASLSTTPAEARQVRRLPATGQWVVEYADDSCRLAREFGDKDKRVTVIFEQFVPGDIFKLLFVGKMIRPQSNQSPIEATVRFGPNEEADDNRGSLATVGSVAALLLDGEQRLAPWSRAEDLVRKDASERNLPFDPAPLGTAREQAVTLLELGKALPFDLVFETGPMDKPLDALRLCSWDTVKTWGLSIEEQKGLTREAFPIVPSRTWFSSDDYPGKMLRDGFEGNVNFRVIVNSSGAPISCHVQSSTRPQEFDDVVCRQVMKQAKFHPALDASGKPIKSYYRQSVQFRIGQ
ncbi:MAG: TonB family protein [Sphingomicrobium sp.]